MRRPGARRADGWNTQALCETAVLLAAATGISMITIFSAPYGGSVTPASMLPVIAVGIRWGKKWGFAGGAVYGLMQFIVGAYAISPFALFLDYIAAFGVLGFSSFFRGKKYGIIIAAPVCCFLRFMLHYISGILLWGMYAPEGMEVWYYSLVYNGGYMLPETIVTTIAAAAVYFPLERFWRINAK